MRSDSDPVEWRRHAEEQASALLRRVAELRQAVDAANEGHSEWKDALGLGLVLR